MTFIEAFRASKRKHLPIQEWAKRQKRSDD